MNDLVDEYQQQQNHRDWPGLLKRLPVQSGSHVLDVGCSNGEVAQLLSRQGCSVVGIDMNDDLLEEARRRNLANCQFYNSEFMAFETPYKFDGIWASYVAAYFTELEPFLLRCRELLKPGAWIALLEVSDLLNHAPLEDKYQNDIKRFYHMMLEAGHYDFMSGVKLSTALSRSGFSDVSEEQIDESEFTFQGRARPQIYKSWEMRLLRLKGIRQYMENPDGFVKAFLNALDSPSHQSNCQVFLVKARRLS